MAGPHPSGGGTADAAAATPSVATPAAVRWSAAAFLPPLAIAIFALGCGLIIAAAGSTLGYDYQAYVAAAHRILDGQPLYDPSVSVAGGFAIYLYPPPFALAMIPFALVPESVGLWAWLGLLVTAFLAGVALLPVRRDVRWLIVLLAGLNWPFLFSLKLGQVGPLLFFACAAGWRSLDRPAPLGGSMALGALVKIQPGLLFGWAIVTRRWRAAAIGLGCVAAAAAISFVVLGPGTWTDYVDLLRRVSSPITTPHNFTPGAIAYQLGADEATANLIQLLTIAMALLVSLAAWLWAEAAASFVVTVVASQLISPLLWDHYAMLLLIPTAFLLQRRQWWAVVLPLGGWLAPPVYPILFALGLLGPLVAGPDPDAATARVEPAA